MSTNFNLESLLLPYGYRQIKVRAKANGYTDSEFSKVVTYRSAPRIVFVPPFLHVYNLRAEVQSIEVLYNGEHVMDVPYTFNAEDIHITIDLSDTNYPHEQTYAITVKALDWESNEESAYENGYAFYGVRRKAYSISADGVVAHNDDPAWERTGLAVGKVANANKLTAKPSSFIPAEDDFAMSAHGGEIPVFKDIYIACVKHATRGEYKKLGEGGFAWTNSNYDVMTCFPDMYLARFLDPIINNDGSIDVYENVRVSDQYFSRSVKIDKFRMSTFHSIISNNTHFSRAGAVPCKGTPIASLRTFAKNMNSTNNVVSKVSVSDWHIFVIRALFLIKYATFDSHQSVGRGGNPSTGYNGGGTNGAFTTLQGRDGFIGTDGSTSVWCLGLCDLWNNLGEFIDGVAQRLGFKFLFATDPDKYIDNPTAETDGYEELEYTFYSALGTNSVHPSFLDVDNTQDDMRCLIGFGSNRCISVGSGKGIGYHMHGNGNFSIATGGYSGSSQNLFCSGHVSWGGVGTGYGCRFVETYL